MFKEIFVHGERIRCKLPFLYGANSACTSGWDWLTLAAWSCRTKHYLQPVQNRLPNLLENSIWSNKQISSLEVSMAIASQIHIDSGSNERNTNSFSFFPIRKSLIVIKRKKRKGWKLSQFSIISTSQLALGYNAYAKCVKGVYLSVFFLLVIPKH